ncbi:MAG: hypothetical protein H0X71_05270, partial [Rubrobacter sp.]|nr:hypothetical protein [Rubrobacter sp.]
MPRGRVGRSRFLISQARVRVLTPLLLVTFLFCHGFMGAPQHSLAQPDHPHLSKEHSSHPAGGHDRHSDGHHLGHLDYVAALISVLFGVVIGLLLSGARAWTKPAALRPPQGFFPPPILCP